MTHEALVTVDFYGNMTSDEYEIVGTEHDLDDRYDVRVFDNGALRVQMIAPSGGTTSVVYASGYWRRVRTLVRKVEDVDG